MHGPLFKLFLLLFGSLLVTGCSAPDDFEAPATPTPPTLAEGSRPAAQVAELLESVTTTPAAQPTAIDMTVKSVLPPENAFSGASVHLYSEPGYYGVQSTLDVDYPVQMFPQVENADIYFIVSPREPADLAFAIQPVNRAIALEVADDPGEIPLDESAALQFCVENIRAFSAAPIPINDASTDSRYCVLSAEGRLALLAVAWFRPNLQRGSAEIRFSLTSPNNSYRDDYAAAARLIEFPTPVPGPTPIVIPPTTTLPASEHLVTANRVMLGLNWFNSGAVIKTIDLDTGAIVEDEAGDLEFSGDCGSQCLWGVVARHGALAAALRESSPTLADCRESDQPYQPTLIYLAVPGVYLCVETNEGNLALVLVEAIGDIASGEEWVLLSFTTVAQQATE
ncbi:MAG: hypothetical protein KC546_19715 [Anaerolineae bacterium]|nr:hypothetical protein [Anaerolineae bacterium]